MGDNVGNSYIRPFSNPPGVQQTSGLQTSGTSTSDAMGTDDSPGFKATGSSESAAKSKPNFGPNGNKRIDDA